MILDEFLIKLGVVSDTKKLDEFKAGLGAIASTATAVVGVVGGLTAGVTAFFGSALSGLDDLNNLASDTDTSLEYIQKLGYAASLSGSSVESANASIKGLAQTIGEAASGMGRGEATFKKLGLSAKNADGSVRSVNDVIAEVSERMQGMSRSEQLNMLGKLGIDQTMIGLLSSTSSEMAELFNEAEALGLVTAHGADAAAEYNDALDQMKHVTGALRTNIAIGLAPQLTKLMSGMKDWLIQNKELVQNGINKLVDWVLAIGKAILNFISAISKVIESTIGWKNALLTLVTILAYVKRATIAAFAVNPVFWIVAAIAGLILLVDDLFTFLNGGKSAFDWSWALPIIEKFKPIIERLSESFGKLFDVMIKIGGAAFAYLSAWWSKYGDNVISYIMHMIDAFSYFASFISNVISAVVALLEGDWKGFFSYLNEAIKDLNDFFESIFKAIWQYVKAILGFIGVDVDVFVGAFESAVNSVKTAWDTVMGALKTAWDATMGVIMAGVDKVKGALDWIGEKLGITSSEIDDVNAKAQQVASSEAFTAAIAQGVSTAQSASAMTAKNAVPNVNSNSTANTKNEFNNNAQVSTTINIQGGDAKETAKEVESVIDRKNKIALSNNQGPIKL